MPLLPLNTAERSTLAGSIREELQGTPGLSSPEVVVKGRSKPSTRAKTRPDPKPAYRPTDPTPARTVGKGHGPVPLPELAVAAVLNLSKALAHLWDALPGRVSRPAELERLLKIDQPLASRLWRLAGTTVPAEAASVLPTVNQLRAAVMAAKKAGAKLHAASAAIDAVEAFDEFVREHAGSAAQFEALIGRSGGDSGHGNGGNESLLERHRRAAFKANSQVFGTQVHAAVHSCVFYEGRSAGPGQSTEHRSEHVLVVRGFVGLQSLRPEAPLQVKTRFRYVPGSESAPSGEATPVPNAAMQQTRLVDGFGEGPAPELTIAEDAGGFSVTQIRLAGIGKSGAATFYLEQTAFDTASRSEPNPVFGMLPLVPVPAELLQLDLWVPVGWSDPKTISTGAFFCGHSPESARLCRDADRVEVHAAAQYLGRSDQPTPTPDVPQWSGVMSHLLEKHGLTGQAFDMYRCRVRFPILHSVVRLGVKGTPAR